MPVRRVDSNLVRLVVGERGRVTMCTELVLRFGYGAIVPWVTRVDDATLRAVAGPDMVVLRTPVRLTGQNMKTVGEFEVAAGETAPFVLTYALSHVLPPEPVDPVSALATTESFWTDWSKKCRPRRTLLRSGAALADHAQGLHLLADRRHRGGADHLAAGAAGRGEKLGLSLLLAARRDADPARADGLWLLRRGAGVARVAVAGGGGESRTGADHVRHCRRAAADRMGGAVAAGIRGLRAGAHRQCRPRSAAARRDRK